MSRMEVTNTLAEARNREEVIQEYLWRSLLSVARGSSSAGANLALSPWATQELHC
jgi:hypothetical protein